MESQTLLRKQLISLLTETNAHVMFEQAIQDFPLQQIHAHVAGIPYSAWELLEHIRIAQWDILEFMRNANHTSPPWPQGYWPPEDAQPTIESWHTTIDQIRRDLKAVQEIVLDEEIDLLSELPHAPGYTYLREILLVADHNAYHIGQFITLRRALGNWPS
ncbi:MAG: DinB family protein [Calditrichaeota bacterium]|nr:MAG: DinB family protein [Calditrichota bacterium]